VDEAAADEDRHHGQRPHLWQRPAASGDVWKCLLGANWFCYNRLDMCRVLFRPGCKAPPAWRALAAWSALPLPTALRQEAASHVRAVPIC